MLSLDAPTVAALWVVFIARCAAVPLPWTAPAAMFVAVWMLYAADRLLDARPQVNGVPPPDLEERHRFHQRHRGGFLSCIAGISVVLAALLDRIDPRALQLYALLAALLAAWLLLIHTRPLPADACPLPGDKARRLPKELAVGLFFPAAVFIPTVAREPQLRLALLPVAALFAATCTLNCLFLYAWENPAPRLRAHWTTRWACRHLAAFSTSAIALAGLTAWLGSRKPWLHLDVAPALACGLSAALLLTLHVQRERLTPLTLRALADVVLLTPLLLLIAR